MDKYDLLELISNAWPSSELDAKSWHDVIEEKGYDSVDLAKIWPWLRDNCHYAPSLAKLQQAAEETGVIARKRPAGMTGRSFSLDAVNDCDRCGGVGLVRVIADFDRHPLREIPFVAHERRKPGEYEMLTVCHCSAADRQPPIAKKQPSWSSDLEEAEEQ